jgi:hypothetical protein
MVLDKITEDEIKKAIGALFPNAVKSIWYLDPDSIHSLAESSGVNLVWKKIGWWNIFDRGHHNEIISYEKFCESIFTKTKSENESVWVVLDPSYFNEDFAYSIKFKDLKTFVEVAFPQIYNLDFVEPFDYIFYFPADKHLVMIHHHGEVTDFQFKE